MTAAETSRFVSTLALALGLMTPSAAVAIPGSPGADVSAEQTALESPARMHTPEQDEPVADSTAIAPSAETLETDPAARSENHSARTRLNTPCLQGVPKSAGPDKDTANTLCIESSERQARVSVQFGRRIRAESGMLGKLDGLLVDYRLSNGVTLNGVAGYPVLSSRDEFNADRQVFGISATTRKIARAWDLSSYVMQQQDNGRADSRAIGGAVRYLRPKRALLLTADYDVGESSLSTLMISGAWKLLRTTTISATLDVRQSYLRTPQEGYLKQTLASTQGWKWGLPMDRIRQLASKPSTEVKTLAVGLSHTFSRHLDLSGDVAVLDVWRDAAPNDPGGVSASNSEYFYRLKLTGKDLMIRGDHSMLDLRHSITESSRSSSASLNTKYAINRLWQVSPRLRTDYRSNELSKSVRWVTSPAVKMEYRWRQQYGINIEAGGEWSTEKLSAQDRSRSSYFLSLGYQAKF